jgi:hypothetical protein
MKRPEEHSRQGRDTINRQSIFALSEIAAVGLADPAVRSRLLDLGMEIFPREKQTPEALGALVKADAEKWWPIIKELGIKAIVLDSHLGSQEFQ